MEVFFLFRKRKRAIASCVLAMTMGVAATAEAAAPTAHFVAKAAHQYRLSIAGDKAQLERSRDRDDRRERRAESFRIVAGVSQATLDAIAACESGGDPTAVDASGTYFGKYQFATDTWAAVGGSGNPAEASAAEQDYRASLLYSQAGSSPWPVCGV